MSFLYQVSSLRNKAFAVISIFALNIISNKNQSKLGS